MAGRGASTEAVALPQFAVPDADLVQLAFQQVGDPIVSGVGHGILRRHHAFPPGPTQDGVPARNPRPPDGPTAVRHVRRDRRLRRTPFPGYNHRRRRRMIV
jgi:hypothetical protein